MKFMSVSMTIKQVKKLPDWKLNLVGISIDHMGNYYTTNGLTILSDANGAFNFNPYSRCRCNQYLKLSTQAYIGALYSVNQYTETTGRPIHSKEGSGGPNVVYAKFLRKDGNDLYFSADLYRKAPVDIHIRQVSEYSDSLKAIFNASLSGSDPLNIANNFGINDLLGNGIELNPDKKIDTTIRVYAFGDYLNKVSWSVYGIVVQQYGLGDIIGRKNISTGNLEEKIFPSDIPTSITIIF